MIAALPDLCSDIPLRNGLPEVLERQPPALGVQVHRVEQRAVHIEENRFIHVG
jgi:hypothetical protein